MLSSLGNLLTDIFVAKLKNGHLTNSLSNFLFYKCYMNDTLNICDPDSDTNKLLDTLNSVHKGINFSREREKCYKKMCANDTLDDEYGGFIDNTLRFRVKHMKPKLRKPIIISAETKILHMNLAFKGDVTSELLVRRLSKVNLLH